VLRRRRGRPEIPGLDQLEVARDLIAVLGELELRGAGVTLADERLGRDLGILDQQVEARADAGVAAGVVGAVDAEGGVAVRRHPVGYQTPFRAAAAGARKLVLVVVRVNQHRLADTREVRPAGHPERQLAHTRQRGHQDAHQQSDDRNHDQQLNQGKTFPLHGVLLSLLLRFADRPFFYLRHFGQINR